MDAWAVVFEGTGAALIGGAIAAVVALIVVRKQINADRRAQGRAEDVRVAVALQVAAGQLAMALLAYSRLTRLGRHAVDDAFRALWTAIAEAQCRRPEDEATRAWARTFREQMITAVDGYPRSRSSRETDAVIRWINEHAQALASHLESGKPLPQIKPLPSRSRRPR